MRNSKQLICTQGRDKSMLSSTVLDLPSVCRLGQSRLFLRLCARFCNHVASNPTPCPMGNVNIAVLHLIRHVPDTLGKSFTILVQVSQVLCQQIRQRAKGTTEENVLLSAFVFNGRVLL